MRAVRSGVREWIATNDRGAIVKIGDPKADEVFSPGELLQLAVAACSGLSIDHRLTHALGEDVQVEFEVEPDRVPEENRYSGVRTTFKLDLSSLNDDQLAELKAKIDSAIERSCTVGRTLEASATTHIELENTRG